MRDELKRHVEFIPGFDKRDSNPAKNYGINGGKFLFVVSGPFGAVDFSLSASFHPQSAIDHLIRHYNNDATKMMRYHGPEGIYAGYHSPVPRYDDQPVARDECEWLEGRPCYCDGSYLRGDEWGKKFLAEGTAWLWPEMEKEYHELFVNNPVDKSRNNAIKNKM